MDSNSTRIIFWSGGFDSTLLLLNILQDLKDHNDDAIVQCITVISDRIGDAKVEREKAARQKIKDYISKHFTNIIQYREINVGTVDYGSFNEGNVCFGQALLWALTAIPFLEDNANLLFGYILDDHLSTCKFFGPFNNLLNAANELCLKELTFDFPLITYSKRDIIYELLNNYSEIFDYLTCCEGMMSIDDCDHCIPCQKLKDTLICLSTDQNKNISKLAKDILWKRFNVSINVKFAKQSGRLIDKTNTVSVEDSLNTEEHLLKRRCK